MTCISQFSTVGTNLIFKIIIGLIQLLIFNKYIFFLFKKITRVDFYYSLLKT